MKSFNTILRKMTFDDLHDWAGDTILNRGKRYVKRVDQLSRTEKNVLVAWVTGSERYVTSARVDEGCNFEYFCTCPYSWGPCKHAVAVILAAAEHIKRKETIPLLDEDNDLYDALLGGSEEDEPWIDDDWENDEPAYYRVPRRTKAQAEVAKILEDKGRNELLELLVDLSGRFPEARQHIVETEQLAKGQVDKLVHALRSEISALTAEPAWYNHWRGEGSLPDYSHVEEQLRALASQGHADAVLQIGAELWTKGIAHVEQSDDEGETAVAIATCLETVLTSLPQSSLAPPEQLLWVIDRMLEDDYSMLDSAEKLLERRGYIRAQWREVASTLEARLDAMPKPRTPGFSFRYRRERLLIVLLDAYSRAGWKDRIVPRLEDEADACQRYTRLADTLLAAGEKERARHWCVHGYAQTLDDAPGIAAALQERLRAMAQKEGRHDLVAAYRAQDFFDQPSSTSYIELRQAAIDDLPILRRSLTSPLWKSVPMTWSTFTDVFAKPSGGHGRRTRRWRRPWPILTPTLPSVSGKTSSKA